MDGWSSCASRGAGTSSRPDGGGAGEGQVTRAATAASGLGSVHVAALLALLVTAVSCGGMHAPSSVRRLPPPNSGIMRRPPATTPIAAPALPAPPARIARAIAIAEDQRRYGDGELKRL